MAYQINTASFQLDIEYDVIETTNQIKYCALLLSSHHRRQNNQGDKSTWIVTHSEEAALFIKSIDNSWIKENRSWSIHILQNVVQIIGKGINAEELKICTFTQSNNVWHGYPADPMRSRNDIPYSSILKEWVDKGYLTKSKMSKLQKSQCNI